MKRYCFPFFALLFECLLTLNTSAQVALQEEVRSNTIQAIKLFKKGDQQSYPVIRLGETEGLELHFDDLQSSSKSYYYAYILCNADWTPATLSPMDYIKGFTQMRLQQYRFSSGTQSRYVHYQAALPASNNIPSRSGNYLLKIFENADTSKLAFSRKILILDSKASVSVQMQQPFAQETYLSHQKLILNLSFKGLDILNPSREVKVVVMQNNRWDNARTVTNPSFIRGQSFEYSDEQSLVFEGGKEFRWLDLRSFRLQSDRVASVTYNKTPYDVFVRPDTIRSPNRYFYYNDMNGMYVIANLENVNPWWQSDIANVHFTFMPQTPQSFVGQDIFLFGELTQYQLNEKTRMKWNENLNAYETTVMLKNGYYNYNYVTRTTKKPAAPLTYRLTEGTSWEAENTYRVLVYYTPFGSRSDELIGFAEVNSLQYFNPARR